MFAKLAICTTLLFAAIPGSVPAEEINPVVGKSADYTFRATDLERLIAAQPAEIQKRFQDDPEQRVNLVRQLMTQKAVAARARKEGFDRKPDFKEQLGHVIDDFMTREYLARVVAASVTVPEDDVKKYYKENESKFVIQEQVKIRHIFVEAPKEMKEEEKHKALLKIETLQQRLKNGEDFAKVAKEASEDAESAKLGGELGTISPGGTSAEEFEKAAFALKAGEVSGVVKTPYGYHIIRVDERKEKRTATLDEARDYILKKLKNEYEAKKVQEFVEQVSKEAGVEVLADRIIGKKEEGQNNEKQK
ncbi:MAG: peptidylprolyl isomerase [Geobacteraceae bacterium]|nr:peptidylprolyl isomerase [Geobacteraceae bacterium]